MNKIVQFLEARLAEDEKAAQSAAALCGCHPPAPSWHYGDEDTEGRIVVVDDPHPHPQSPLPRPALNRRWHRTYRDLFAAEHITRWDPARVLRDVEAKRRILKRHSPGDPAAAPWAPNWCEGCGTSGYCDDPRTADVNECPELRDLAAAYDWHPDYKETWNV